MRARLNRRDFLLLGTGVLAAGATLALPGVAQAATTGARTASSPPATTPGVTNIESVRREYARAAANWPFSLPQHYRLPAESVLVDPLGEPSVWEARTGTLEAYTNWATLTACAAAATFKRGDVALARRHVLALAEVYEDPMIQQLAQDPDRAYIHQIIEPVLARDEYEMLTKYYGLDRLESREHLASIARFAGDV